MHSYLDLRLALITLAVLGASVACKFENKAGDLDWSSNGPATPCTDTTEQLSVTLASAKLCVGDTFEVGASLRRNCGASEDVSRLAVFATSASAVVACEKTTCRAAGPGWADVVALYQGRESMPVRLTVDGCLTGFSDAGADVNESDAATEDAASDAATEDSGSDAAIADATSD